MTQDKMQREIVKEIHGLEYSNGDPNGIADCDALLVAKYILSRESELVERVRTMVQDANINERPTGRGVSELILVKKVYSILDEIKPKGEII